MTCDHSDSFGPFKDNKEEWCPTCGAVYIHTPGGMKWLERTEEKNLGATNEQLFPGANRTLTRSALLLDASPYSVEVIDLARELACLVQAIVSDAPCYDARELLDQTIAIVQHTTRALGLSSEEEKLLRTATQLARRAVNHRYRDEGPDTKVMVRIYETASDIMRRLP